MSELEDFDLEFNHMQGPLPNTISHLNVVEMGLGGNNFTGAVPEDICDIPATHGPACALDTNPFNCPLPDCIVENCAASCSR